MEQLPETVRVAAPYHVFINHRGPDVKKTLASLIYHRLTDCHGLRVFLDEKEIYTGDALPPAIIGAIQSASVHVAIFSGRYAESSWCLEELHWILRSYHERNTQIIPVFFGVEPKDLRHIESGLYAIAFEKHQSKGRFAMAVIEKWRTALYETSMIAGELFKTDESDLGKILENIVHIVLKEVFKREALEVAQYPVGLDQAANDFQNEILKHSHSNATTTVGIAGLGGVGKSTLAKHLYNLKRHDFSRSSICEVREKGLRSSQEKLLRDLLGNYHSQHIDSISQGKRILRDCLPRLPPVFIVLDDVDNMDQIESLLDVDAVASGSLILITSRDKDVLRRSSAKTVVYDVKTLHQNHARELFCRHAFSQSKPPEELDDLIGEFLKICGGLPLSLKVLGGLLSGRCDKDYWEWQLEKLSTTQPNEIINSLKVSYEALDREEKEVFLDIGCFLVGEEKELAIRVLEGLHDSNRIGDHLESLRKKCLVHFDYDVQLDRKRKYPIGYNYVCLSITMHNQLRELARHIAREEFRDFPTRNPLRLSSSTDMEMLRSQAGPTFKIRGIRSWKDENSSIGNNYNRESRAEMEGVRLFVVEHESFESSFYPWRPHMSGDLVWLRLCRFSCSRFLFSMSLRRLRVLEIHGSGHLDPSWCSDEWDPLDPRPNTLTSQLPHDYNIPPSSSKVGQPESSRQRPLSSGFGGFTQLLSFNRFLENSVQGMKTLTKLVLKNIGFLKSLPIDFSQLQNLRHLDLTDCYHLIELPKTFSELLQLQYLALQDCFRLSIPLDILGEISTLEYVDFQGCAKLVCLPERIPYQRHLRYLNLLGTGLLQLPDNLGILDKLEQITIGSSALKQIPLTVANLKGLAELFLIGCSGLQQILPEGIAAPNIKILAIDRCPIDNFSFQDQGNLDVENIHLRVGMSFLRDLILTNTSICQISIHDCVFPRLETIDLSGNIQLVHVNALPSALVSLNLQNCCGLKTLTSLSNLVNLKFLNINRCFNLKTLNMEGLASLEEIKAEECWELQRIQGLNQRERLSCVHISTDNTVIWTDICLLLRERLNCLHFSTDNRVIWDDVCGFLRSPSHQKPSTAIFSGTADNYKIFGQEDMRRIAKKFNLEIFDIFLVSDGIAGLPQGLYNFHSHSAILMFLVTDNVKWRFCVRFTPAISHDESSLEYSSLTRGRGRGGRGVHVFMWTEESRLFKEYRVYSDIKVSLSLSLLAEERIWVANSGNNVEEVRGWIVMVDKKTDVSQVCRDLIMESA